MMIQRVERVRARGCEVEAVGARARRRRKSPGGERAHAARL